MRLGIRGQAAVGREVGGQHQVRGQVTKRPSGGGGTCGV